MTICDRYCLSKTESTALKTTCISIILSLKLNIVIFVGSIVCCFTFKESDPRTTSYIPLVATRITFSG